MENKKFDCQCINIPVTGDIVICHVDKPSKNFRVTFASGCFVDVDTIEIARASCCGKVGATIKNLVWRDPDLV